MSIPPLSSLNIAASIAGTDRAASAEVASGHAKGAGGATGSTAAYQIVEQTEKITKSELSGDSDADGRQTLDSFERRQHDESQTQQNAPEENDSVDNGLPEHLNLIVNRPTLGGHIDLCG
ncbi:MAG TPA: hypothetical protein DDZ51_23605 [Planctomycetaceae bacterium]|nr:hypothetical protein [Planctomycetaceae bacterium]